jgi:hypothetical protein
MAELKITTRQSGRCDRYQEYDVNPLAVWWVRGSKSVHRLEVGIFLKVSTDCSGSAAQSDQDVGEMPDRTGCSRSALISILVPLPSSTVSQNVVS